MFAASILRVMTLFIAALATGALMVNWVGLARAMLRLSSASAYVGLHQATNRTFDPYMPTVVIGALLGGVVLAALSPGLRSPSGQLAVLGALCYAAVMMTSLSTNVRINRQVARWSASNWPIRDSETGRCGGIKLTGEIRLIDVPRRFHQKKQGARFEGVRSFGEECAGARHFMHHGKYEREVDRIGQVSDVQAIGSCYARVDALQQSRLGRAAF